jgi:hypothetical protein
MMRNVINFDDVESSYRQCNDIDDSVPVDMNDVWDWVDEVLEDMKAQDEANKFGVDY